MLITELSAAVALGAAFFLLADPLGEVSAARVGAVVVVVGGPVLVAVLTSGGVLAVARGIVVEVLLGVLAYGASALLVSSTEFLLVGLATAWAAGTAVAVHAAGPASVLGRVALMSAAGPLLLIAAVWGFDFYVVGAIPGLVGLALLVPLGDAVGSFVADLGTVADEGRVERS